MASPYSESRENYAEKRLNDLERLYQATLKGFREANAEKGLIELGKNAKRLLEECKKIADHTSQEAGLERKRKALLKKSFELELDIDCTPDPRQILNQTEKEDQEQMLEIIKDLETRTATALIGEGDETNENLFKRLKGYREDYKKLNRELGITSKIRDAALKERLKERVERTRAQIERILVHRR